MVTSKDYINTQRKKGEIKTKVTRGITSTKINNIKTATQGAINQAKKDLLKPLVLDTNLLTLLSTDENFKKLQHHLEYKLRVKNSKNETLLEAFKHGITINKAQEHINEVSKNTQTRKDKSDPILQQLKKHGWTGNSISEGTIKNWELEIIFRRA